jgi:cell division septal protein FtsQ
MAARTKKNAEAPEAAAETEAVDAGPAEADDAQSAPAEVEEERPRRKAKARAPSRSVTPLRERFRRKSSSGGDESRRPMQRSLFSAMAPEVMSQRAAKVGGGLIVFVVLIGGVMVGYHFFAGSRFFTLREVDVEGNTLLASSEVASMVREKVQYGVLNADLAKLRDELQQYPLIQRAQVIRLLPDRLRIRIKERTPIAVARLSDDTVACVDENGAIFGDLNTWRAGIMPPIIRGLAESGDRMQETNLEDIQTYKRLLRELDEKDPPLSSRVDEVTFDPDQGIRLTLTDSRIIVLIGSTDFRARLNAALDVIDAVNKKDASTLNVLRIGDAERLLAGVPIKYLNVIDPNRIVVGLNE